MQTISMVSVLVNDYDEAIAFYRDQLGFQLKEDTKLTAEKRWVVVMPPGNGNCAVLLAKAANELQASRVGNQTGGRVFLFLHTSDICSDYEAMRAKGVNFRRKPTVEPYGTVAVFEDLYGNLWDLIQPA